MALVYMDLIKLALPASVRGFSGNTGAQYVAFGSYDLLHYSLPNGREANDFTWLEAGHEDRHGLDWNYERHPVHLYCPRSFLERVRHILEPTSYPNRPLVLTMVRIVKYPLLKERPSLNRVVRAFQTALERELNDSSGVELVVCWNLGNADFLILSRPNKLRMLEDLYLSIGRKGFCLMGDGVEGPRTKIVSFSSHCAFPIASTVEQDDGQTDYRIDENDLKSWLVNDDGLQFIDFADVSADIQAMDEGFGARRFLFGDRDYQLYGNLGSDEQSRAKSVVTIVKELLDPTYGATIQSSSLIPSLPVPLASDNGDQVEVGDGLVGTMEGVAMPTYPLPWDDLESSGKAVVAALEAMRGRAESELRIPERSRDKCVKQIEHCANTLTALYSHALRLYGTAYQDDVFAVVRRLYDSMAQTLQVYADEMCKDVSDGQVMNLCNLLARVYVRVMLFVSEMQHVFTVLAISPHSYMETYYGSMRSLNASSKLWTSYNGVIGTLCALFPTQNLGKTQDCRVLLVPYREKYSQSEELLSDYRSGSLLVLVRVNYRTMFNIKSTLFIIAHELGHYVFNETREMRMGWMQKSYTAFLLLRYYKDMMKLPLLVLANMPDRGFRENRDKCIRSIELPNPSLSALDVTKRKLALRCLDDLTESEYEAIYEEMSECLRVRYSKVFASIADELHDAFASWYESFAAHDDSLSYCLGASVRKRMYIFAKEYMGRCRLEAFRRTGEENAMFLESIDKHGHRFDRQQVVKLWTYWKSIAKDPDALDEMPAESHAADMLDRQSTQTLRLFREIHADIFACKAIDFKMCDYLDYVSEFVGTSPRLIANDDNLLRLMVVCESAFGDDKCRGIIGWLNTSDQCPYDKDVRKKALDNLRYMRQMPYYGYLIEYGRAVVVSVDKRVEQIERNDCGRKQLARVRKFAHGKKSLKQMWHFWVGSMQ